VSAAVQAAARAWRDENARRWPVFSEAVAWDALPHATRQNDLTVMAVALEAAAPFIEARVREQVAAREVTLLAMFEAVGEYGEALLNVPNRTAQSIGEALVKAARIARGESR